MQMELTGPLWGRIVAWIIAGAWLLVMGALSLADLILGDEARRCRPQAGEPRFHWPLAERCKTCANHTTNGSYCDGVPMYIGTDDCDCWEPAEPTPSAIRNPKSPIPLVRLGQGDYTREWYG